MNETSMRKKYLWQQTSTSTILKTRWRDRVKAEADKILSLFRKHNIEYQLYEHEPVYTSLQAAAVRGVDLKTGCKSMVLRTKDGKFILANIAADKRIDLKKLEKIVGSKLRFATREEVLQATNCVPGSVPPFGKLFGLQTYLDESVLENDSVNFNIGLLTKSVKIKKIDFLKVMEPTISEFSKT
jgi:Ala-tRNA(Pro) deacylase